MITQSIRTGKYTTTIDIPAQKLHTRAKFIQISKNTNPREEIITIPNVCYQKQHQKRQINLQTKILIEELQQAYNQDVHALEDKISQLKTSHQIEKIKLENLLQYHKRDLQNQKKRAQQSDRHLNRSIESHSSRIQFLQSEGQSRQFQLTSKSKVIEKLETQIIALKKDNEQKGQLLSSRFKQFETQKDKRFSQERRGYEKKLQEYKMTIQDFHKQIDRSRQHNNQTTSRVVRLQKQNLSLLEDRNEIRKLNEFQSREIQSYIKNINDFEVENRILQQDKQNLHKKIQQQNSLIQKLRDQLRLQLHILEKHNFSSNTQDNQMRILANKVIQYEDLFAQREKEFIQSKTLYLLKLKEIDEQRQYSKNIQIELNSAKNKIKDKHKQLEVLSNEFQQLKNELTKKIIENSQLSSRPPQQHVYEVVIEKSIDRKEYIEQLESKVSGLQKVNSSLKEDNQSYVQQIKKKFMEQQQANKRQKSLEESLEEMKKYIAKRQKSIAWVTERQISKDVQISKDQSDKSQSYRVYVKQSSSSSKNNSYQDQVSEIVRVQDINFSVEPKIQNILHPKHIYSVIQKGLSEQN